MWSLSLDDIQRVKEELRGRRAALRVRYDAEIQALEADIANIETLELAANLFVAKYRDEAGTGGALAELTAVGDEASGDPGTAAEPQPRRNWRALLDAQAEPADGEPG